MSSTYFRQLKKERDLYYMAYFSTQYDDELFCHHHLQKKEELWAGQFECSACFEEYHEHITSEPSFEDDLKEQERIYADSKCFS